MSDRHCCRTRKAAEAVSVYIDADHPRPGEGQRRERAVEGGWEVAELSTDQADGYGRQQPRPIIHTFSRPCEAHSFLRHSLSPYVTYISTNRQEPVKDNCSLEMP